MAPSKPALVPNPSLGKSSNGAFRLFTLRSLRASAQAVVSPDGSRVAFSSDWTGWPETYVAELGQICAAPPPLRRAAFAFRARVPQEVANSSAAIVGLLRGRPLSTPWLSSHGTFPRKSNIGSTRKGLISTTFYWLRSEPWSRARSWANKNEKVHGQFCGRGFSLVILRRDPTDGRSKTEPSHYVFVSPPLVAD